MLHIGKNLITLIIPVSSYILRNTLLQEVLYFSPNYSEETERLSNQQVSLVSYSYMWSQVCSVMSNFCDPWLQLTRLFLHGFFRQECWGCHFPPLEDLPDMLLNQAPGFPASQADSSPVEPSGKPCPMVVTLLWGCWVIWFRNKGSNLLAPCSRVISCFVLSLYHTCVFLFPFSSFSTFLAS